MRQTNLLATAALLAALATPTVTPALAGTALPNTADVVLNIGGWAITLSGCTLRLGGVTTSGCPGEDVTATVTGGTLSLVFTGTGGGNLLFATGGSSNFGDISLSIAATNPNGIDTISLALAGGDTTGGNADLLKITGGGPVVEVVGGVNTIVGNLANNLGTPAGASPSVTFTSVTGPVTFTPDLKVQSIGGVPGDAMTLASATVTLRQVPEPGTIAVFAAGLVGLVAVRRPRGRAIRST